MAHKKGVGSSRNGRDSGPKDLGVKAFGGEFVRAGSILVKQRGTKFHPGQNVRRASDDTLFTVVDGQVKFEHKNKKRYKVSVYPAAKEADGDGQRRTATAEARAAGELPPPFCLWGFPRGTYNPPTRKTGLLPSGS